MSQKKNLNTQKLLELFSNLHGASGFEAPIREQLELYLKKHSYGYQIDHLGNIFGSIANKKHSKVSVLVMAHMDEVGFLIQHIDEKGFIRAIPLGRWLNENVWDKEWFITLSNGKTIIAYSGMESPHLTSTPNKKPLGLDKLFFDTGFTKEELIQKGVRPGLPITPLSPFRVFADGAFYSGKALDDRVGLVLILELLEFFKKSSLSNKLELQFAATVQEEEGRRGALLISHTLKPDMVINLEASVAQDYPEQFSNIHCIYLGKGPSLFAFDGTMVPDQNLLNRLASCATKNNIPFQWEVESSYGEDASRLQTVGIPAINIGVPIRYLHSHHAVMRKSDYEATLKLLCCFLKSVS